VELLTALLTGFFLWLLVFHWQRSRRARVRELAGPLLLEVRTAPRLARARRWAMAFNLALQLIYPAMIIAMYCQMRAWFPEFPDILHLVIYHFATYLAIAGYFCVLLSLVASMTGWKNSFEIRENGILHILGLLKFVPWGRITECRWFVAKGRLGRWLRWKTPRPHEKSRFTIVEARIEPGQKPAVTAALARFAHVYDDDGTLLAQPSEADVAARATAPAMQPGRTLFQFNLQSLMLLVVVVSCAASCYGIHLRRLQPYREAAARLAAIRPSSDDFGGIPYLLDFSKCAIKPTDDDLVCLEPLDEVWSLDLSGAPVTDAGIVHLKRMKGLTYVNLADTKVTARGAAELSRALPGADVIYGPSGGRQMLGPHSRRAAAPPSGGK
jgi:hypothetical protein